MQSLNVILNFLFVTENIRTTRINIWERINDSGSAAVLMNSPSSLKIENLIFYLRRSPPFISVKVIEAPKPIRILNIGPAILPVTAISPNPFLVIATLAVISPRQFPHAKIVSPNSALGSLVINPISLNISIMQLDAKLIHTMLITKLRMANTVIKDSGPLVFLV